MMTDHEYDKHRRHVAALAIRAAVGRVADALLAPFRQNHATAIDRGASP